MEKTERFDQPQQIINSEVGEVSKYSIAAKLFINGAYLLLFWVALPAFLTITGLRFDQLLRVSFPRNGFTIVLGLVMALLGAGAIVLSIWQFWVRGRGLPISHLPPSALVQTGLYRVVRHPLYVGYTLLITGTAFLLLSPGLLFIGVPFLVVGWVLYVVFFEEPQLIERHGAQYLDYRKQVGLLVPPGWGARLKERFRPLLKTSSEMLDSLAQWTILFRRGNLILVTFGLFVTVGTMVFAQHTTMLLLAHGIPWKQAVDLMISSALSALVVTRIFALVEDWRITRTNPLAELRRQRYVSWGAYAGLLLAACLFAIRYDYQPLLITDIVVRGMFTAWALGRIGCITYGCCYGVVSPEYGITYRNAHSRLVREGHHSGGPRYPIQLYSAIEHALLFLLLNLLAFRPLPVGFLTALGLLLYPVGRTVIEFLRDRPRYWKGRFTGGHFWCLIMFAGGWMILFSISPEPGQLSPEPWSLPAMIDSLSLTPVVLLLGAVTFVVTSLHWKKVGTW